MDHKIPNRDEGEANEEAEGASEVGHLKLFAKGIVNQLLVFLHFDLWPYLIFVIFFTLAKFLENKIYTEKRQFFALNL